MSVVVDLLADFTLIPVRGMVDGTQGWHWKMDRNIHVAAVSVAGSADPSHVLKATYRLSEVKQSASRIRSCIRSLVPRALAILLVGASVNSARAAGDGCFAAPTPECLIAEAIEAIEKLPRPELRVVPLVSIAVAQAKAGNKEAARSTFAVVLKTVRSIGNAKLRADWLKDIAVAQTNIGAFTEALATAQTIDDEKKRAEVFGKIAVMRANAGQFREALETARTIGRVDRVLY